MKLENGWDVFVFVPVGDAAESELLTLSSAVDLLCGPVPSCLPSPDLHPDPVLLQHSDLINFEEKSSTGWFLSTNFPHICHISWPNVLFLSGFRLRLF